MKAFIRAIEYYLPERVLTNDELSAQFPEWSVTKIAEKTGIVQRHIVADGECVSDMAVAAGKKLFDSGVCSPSDIDFVLLCTQSPDYFLPTTACLVQDRLGISQEAGALDYNLGCSGFVYGLSLAKGLVETGQARNVLLITAEAYSKHIHPADKSVRTIFGDAAAATLIQGREDGETPLMGPFVLGTDGRGAPNLIVPCGGMRKRSATEAESATRTERNLFMNGPEIFNFTLRVVPTCAKDLLAKAGVGMDDVDLFVFHQANQYMLEHLRQKAGIPAEKYYIFLRDVGNTVSATIPIALRNAVQEGRLKPGDRKSVV